jgi:hypothetical protein
MQKLKQNETTATYRRIYMFLASSADGYTPVTSLVGATVNLFKNGVAFSSQPTTPASLTHISQGHWYYEIPQSYLSDLGILTLTVQDTNIRPVVLMGEVVDYNWYSSTGATAQQVWEYADRQLTASLDPTATQIWAAATRTLTNGAITNSTIANNAIVLRLANDALPSNARFTTYDTFSGYPLLSQSAQHQVSITGAHHAAADVHEFQPDVITNTATDVSFVTEMVNAIWDELTTGHNVVNSFGKLLKDLRLSTYVTSGLVTSAVSPTADVFSTNLVALDGTYDHQTLLFITGDLAGESKPVLSSLQSSGQITSEEAFTGIPQVGDEFYILPTHVHAIESIADGILSRLLDSSGSSNDVFNERTVRSALRAMRNKVIVSSGNISVYKEDDSTAAWEGTVSNITDVTVNPDGGA